MKRKVSILLCLFLFLNCFDQKKEKENFKNSQRLQVGMPFAEALSIMGEPDGIKGIENNPIYKYNTSLDSIYIYYYTPPTGSSSGIEFYTDSLKVIKVYNQLD